MNTRLLLTLLASLIASPVLADDRFDRPSRGWEADRRQFLYDYDPRSPYPQHPIYPRDYRRESPGTRWDDSRDWRFGRDHRWLEDRRWRDHQRWRKDYRNDRWHGYPRSGDWRDKRWDHRYRQPTPQGFYYGPYPSYPTYPSYRFYRQ